MTGDGIPQDGSGREVVCVDRTFLTVKDIEDNQPTMQRSSSAGILPSELKRSSSSDHPTGGAPPPKLQRLPRADTIRSTFFKVDWTVNSKKLVKRERQIVSPSFELKFGPDHPNVPCKMTIFPDHPNVPCKMTISPKSMGREIKRALDFKNSKGHGWVQLKCEAELPASLASVSFVISIGSGKNIKEARGPVEHCFSSSAVCGLPRNGRDIWNFCEVVDQASQTFAVGLEITATKDVVPRQ